MKRKPLLLLGILALIVLSFVFPWTMLAGFKISRGYALQMIYIFPAVLILMGLADVWVPKETIEKYLGDQSGLKGILLAVFLGTLPTGPVYMAFPVAAELLGKNASTTNVMVFLGVWASLKIPQIGMEVQFLGLKFAALRFVLTLGTVLVTSFLIGFLDKKASLAEAGDSPDFG